jgi:hypothetical protein
MLAACTLYCTALSDFRLSSSIFFIASQCLHCSGKRRRPMFEKVCNISMEATPSRSAVRFSPPSKEPYRLPFAAALLPTWISYGVLALCLAQAMAAVALQRTLRSGVVSQSG